MKNMLRTWHLRQSGGCVERELVVIAKIINDIKTIFQAIHEHSKKVKCKTGLTGPQLWAIQLIGELSSVGVSELAAKMYVHSATVVGILNRLELQGLIRRIRSNKDRRVVKVELTDAGHEIAAKAPRVVQGLLVTGLEVLPIEKLKDISACLAELVDILKAREISPQLILSPEVNLPPGQGKRRQRT